MIRFTILGWGYVWLSQCVSILRAAFESVLPKDRADAISSLLTAPRCYQMLPDATAPRCYLLPAPSLVVSIAPSWISGNPSPWRTVRWILWKKLQGTFLSCAEVLYAIRDVLDKKRSVFDSFSMGITVALSSNSALVSIPTLPCPRAPESNSANLSSYASHMNSLCVLLFPSLSISLSS